VTADISFAIPYYSAPEYLREALASLRSQTHLNWEAVVVDDASPEPIADLIAELDDHRITYVRNDTNLGLAANWNKAIGRTTAPLVCVLHSDDLLEPNYATTMIGIMTSTPEASAGHCRVSIIGANGLPRRTLTDFVKRIIQPKAKSLIVSAGEDGLASMLRGSWIYCPTLCFRRSHLPSVPFDNSWRFMLDFDLIARIFLNGQQIIGTTSKLYRYRRHDGAQTRVLTNELTRFEEELAFYGQMYRVAKEHQWLTAQRHAKRATVIRLHLLLQVATRLVRLRFASAAKALCLVFRSVK
jgi:glycosyltransferase involved in cell wall biosynthesis